MPDRWAVANGNWNNTATWNGGTLPGSGDDVFADGFSVTINQDVTVLSLRTTQRSGGTAGGSFNVSGQRIINADTYAGTTNCLSLSTNGCVQNGDSYGSQTTNSRSGTILGGTSIQNGDAFGGNGTSSVGTSVNAGLFYGNATGGSASGGHGVTVAAGGVAIVGIATGSTSGAFGVQSTSTLRHVVLIKTEAGSFPKSLGAGAETTDANVPFVNYNAGGGSASARIVNVRGGADQ